MSRFFGGVKANLDVCFSVEPGIVLGLIGPNGAGKTTLFNCITGFYPPSRGEILFEGERIDGLSPDKVCKLGMARTWQKVRPLAKLSVLDNAMVGALLRTGSVREARAIAHEQLRVVGLDAKASALAGALPIGERKKLEVARVLATRPRMILLDEVMGGLNARESEDLIQFILEYQTERIDADGDRARHEGHRPHLRPHRGAQLRREARRGDAAADRQRPAGDDRIPRRQLGSEGMSNAVPRPLLELRDLDFAYGDVHVLHGVSLSVQAGEIVTLVGSNGAGKSTTLRNISRLLRPRAGSIVFDGHDLTKLSSHEVVELGVVQVPEGRRVFPEMTVAENLTMGSYIKSARADRAKNLERGLTLFPRLRERISQLAGTLSGGEQQMLAIARGLMAKPRLLLLDEPSLGLSPLLVKTIFDTIAEINRQGVSVLLVEQNVYQSLRIANRGYVLETGKIALSGSGQELLANDQVKAAFLGA